MAKRKKPVEALEWIAAMGTHVPSRGEQMVRYYGEFSNCLRGRRRKAECVEARPTVLVPELSAAEARKNWARLIQKVYEADPFVCSHFQGRVKVISFIEDRETIRKILEYHPQCGTGSAAHGPCRGHRGARGLQRDRASFPGKTPMAAAQMIALP